MKRVLLLLAALGTGLLLSETLYRWPACRERIEGALSRSKETVATRNLRELSKSEAVRREEIQHQVDLLRAQFGDETAFTRALRESGLNEARLREELAVQLRERIWLEKEIAPSLPVREMEARELYSTQQAQFQQPQRYRAAHIFLAAPEGSAPEVVAAKQSAIQGLAVRMLAGEKFEQLAAEASEDEATKHNGGDLGYFSAARVPPEFIAEIEKLGMGEMSAPIRSHLGFHLVRLDESKPERAMSFEEARPEIDLSLGNARRVTAVAQLTDRRLAR